MDTQFILNLISRWLHVIPAIIMVGGTLFLRLTVVAATEQGSVDATAREAIRKNWVKWIGICTLLLLVSGLYNAFVKATTLHLSPAYNGLLLVKILLALGVFFLAARLSGRSEKAVEMRKREKHWTNILCIMMLGIVLIAGWMKTASGTYDVKDRSEKIVVQTLVAE
jgi:hypothetical protein